MRKFKRVYIEITNICNLSCEFCPKTKRKLQFMKINEFKHILDEIKGYTEYINLHVLGEPLLHPELGQFLELCAEYNYKVNITTNGILINEAKDKIHNKKALRQLNISLHSFDANENSISIEDYMNRIFEFIKSMAKIDYNINFRLWNLENNNDSKNKYIIESIEEFYSLNYSINEKLKESKRIELQEKVFLNGGERFNWPGEQSSIGLEVGFCHGLRNQIAILVDGTVVPCCLDSEATINLGNIFNDSLGKIINGERAQNIYKGFSERRVVEDLCKKCDYRRRFDSPV